MERINKHNVTRIIRQKTFDYQEQAFLERKMKEEEEKRREEEEANRENND